MQLTPLNSLGTACFNVSDIVYTSNYSDYKNIMPTHSFLVDTSALYHRRRLLNALSSIHAKPVTYVHAPMGYGKTVAVRHSLEMQELRPVWISVLTRDHKIFWQDFCSVLRKVFSEEPSVLKKLEALGYPSDPSKLDAARSMLSRLAFSSEIVLVFDDMHFLPELEVWRFFRLCLLLARQGGFPPIVFISRHSPNQEFVEPMLKGDVAEIKPALFAFAEKDVAAYFKHCGMPLQKSDVLKLFKATGGWISALYLYLLHYTQHGQLAAPIEISALLERQVFDELREEAKSLLLVLAPLESFAVSQAELFCSEAQAVLVDVCRCNSFIRYDPVTELYVLHALFRDFLQEHFKKLPMDQQQEIYLRHARWLVRHDAVRKAAKLLSEVHDSTEALEILNAVVECLPVTEGNGLLLALFRTFHMSQMDHYPGVMFRYAMAALSAKDILTFSKLLSHLGDYCSSLSEEEPDANAWRGEMELLLAFTQYNDIVAMSEHHKKAAMFFQRQGTGGSRLFGQDPWTLGSPSVLYMYYRESGTLKETMAEMHECLPHYSRLTGMHGAGAEDVMLAEAQYNSGEFDSSAIAAHRALSLAQEYGQISIEVCARFLFAKLDLQRGEYDRATSQLRAMREKVEAEKAFSLLQTVDLCSGFLHVSIHRPEMVPDWLRQEGEERLYSFAKGSSYLVLGGILLLAGEYAEVVGRFTRLLKEGTFSKNVMFSIYANLFVAAGNTGLGFWRKADSALVTALDLALPDKIYMPFVLNFEMLPHLKNWQNDNSCGRDVRKILKLSSSFEKARNGLVSRFFPEDKSSLTPRERELVRLALTGMTYREIGEALSLAPSSVKRYFVTLYKKIGINNREQLKQSFAKEKRKIL